MIRGIVYLTGLVTLFLVALVAALVLQVHRWPWRSIIKEGRQYVTERLEPGDRPGETAAAGEVPSPPKDMPAPEPAAPPSVARHLVCQGETLYALAERYYGRPGRWRAIARANEIRRPSDLRAGRLLLIPLGEEAQTGGGRFVPDLRLGHCPALLEEDASRPKENEE